MDPNRVSVTHYFVMRREDSTLLSCWDLEMTYLHVPYAFDKTSDHWMMTPVQTLVGLERPVTLWNLVNVTILEPLLKDLLVLSPEVFVFPLSRCQ